MRSQWQRALYGTQRGFTLVELVIVMIILAALGIAVTNYLGFGTELYRDVAEREKILNSARFAMERLNREIRGSLPNSQQISNSGNCLRFVPVVASSSYLELPVSPDAPAAVAKVFAFDQYSFSAEHKAAVYALSSDDIYSASSSTVLPVTGYTLAASGSDVDELALAAASLWPLPSPSQRIYIVSRPVRYCVLSNGDLQREEMRWASETPPEQIINSSLMAQGIRLLPATAADYQPPFAVTEATLSRNSVVKLFLNFSRDNGAESLVFHHAIHIQNVP
ncbi:type II secretion system protein [Motilimonas sp. 1_MG-2023]|uniref:PilW family protein n=1 Tax=Motilimonas sp. 1_MG-2023 TaxID=3062672 RepID=UPI0026E407FF|nr:type II secretion system protein [Motilimonas sp. 1_MG-2023]MDO6524150.1 type II secretion system protein [Motilimonas sp. 1_MG-2023]